MLISYIIILLYVLHTGLTLVIFDIEKGVLDVIYGYADVILYLKTIDVFYKYDGDTPYCDTHLQPDDKDRFCDLEVWSRVCIMKQEFIGKRTPKDYEGIDKRTFDMDEYRKITLMDSNTAEFNCGPPTNFSFEQQNAVYFFEPKLPEISRFSAPYSTIFQITAFAGDSQYHGDAGLVPFGIYNNYVNSSRTRIQESISFVQESAVSIMTTTMLEEYVVKAKCSKTYYGRTCWYTCTDDHRLVCNCKEMEVYSNVPCLSYCKPGWLAKYVVYHVENIAETITKCNTMDICVNVLSPVKIDCDFPRVCLPVDNDTYYCELLYVSFQTKLFQGNLTSEIFLFGETIYTDFDKALLKETDVGVNTTTDLNVTEFAFGSKMLIYKQGTEKAGFIVKESVKLDTPYFFTIILNLKAWNKFVTRTRDFRIYVPPNIIHVYHLDDLSYVSTYGYLGEKLYGNSTARPEYKSIFMWTSATINFTFHFGTTVDIPIKTFLGISYVLCHAALLIPDRRGFLDKKYAIFIKPFRSFQWNATSNVLEFNSRVKCFAEAKIVFNLSIVQLQGNSNIRSYQNIIHLKDIVGGLYSFVCNFQAAIGLQYSTYLRFKLRVQATKVCFFLFANIMGSLVQCGHNGYLQDEYYIKVQLLTFNSIEWVVQTQGSRYVRIPYEMKLLKYKVKCTVINTLNKIELSQETDDKLFIEIRRKYYVTDMNKLCLRYEEYIEIPLVYEFAADSVTLSHKLFYFTPNDMGNPFEKPICVLLSTFPFLTFALLINFLLKISDQNALMEKQSKAVIKRLKIRKLNDKLREEARKSLKVDKESISNYFKNTRESKRRSVCIALDHLA